MLHCKNCNNTLNSTDDYCNSCGAKVIRNRLTIKNLFIHFAEQFLNYDNKFLKTIFHLVKYPEDVICSYIDGTRKRYINPISFFAISLTLSGVSIFFIKKFYMDVFDKAAPLFENAGSQKIMEATPSLTLEYNSLILSALIPLLALISLIVFYNKKYNYTEHLVIYLYTMSLVTIISVIFGLIVLLTIPEYYLIYGMCLNFLNFIFHCYLLKRIFKLSVSELTLKTLLFLLIAFITYIGFSILVVIILFATGTFNLQDFAPPS